MELYSLFSQCGLNDSEQRVLISLIEYGPRSAGKIAKTCELKRPTTYAILEALSARGLVQKQKKGSANVFEAIRVALIPDVLISQARREFEKVKQAGQLMIPALEKVEQRSISSVVEYQVNTYLESKAAYAEHFGFATAGDFCAIFNPNVAINSQTKVEIKLFVEKTKKCRIREIAVDGPMAKWYLEQVKNNPKHEVRVISPDKNIYSNMIMREGVVNLTHYSADEMMTIKIAHEDYYHSMITVFEMLWASLS